MLFTRTTARVNLNLHGGFNNHLQSQHALYCEVAPMKLRIREELPAYKDISIRFLLDNGITHLAQKIVDTVISISGWRRF